MAVDKEIDETASCLKDKGCDTNEDAEAASKPESDKPTMVVFPDNSFNLQIQAPGTEPFDLQVTSAELVQELHHMLMDREDTCQRTCFSLQLDGQTLDNFMELKNVENLKEGSVLKVIEESYTAREARLHVRHVRDLLKSADQRDAYDGIDCASLSFLSALAGNVLENNLSKSLKEQIECTPPEYVRPSCKDRPILPLHPSSKDSQAPACVKTLTTSGWNPPQGNRKLHGDLLYLEVLTLEDKRHYITACTKGFFVNSSTHDEFNPRQSSQIKYLSHSLIDLLGHLSPLFRRNFQTLLKKRAMKHPYERVNTPYQVFSWLAPNRPHTFDAMRAEDANNARMGYEEHIPGQTRDWNEELQTTRELPRDSLPERLIRERAIFKVHSDFVLAATRGAVAVVDGSIMPINPGDEGKMQMFLWNNIFFSLGFDVKDHYKDFGGDEAAHVAPSSDLQGVKAYSQIDTEGIYTLGTVIVDYRGYRVTAQSIIPGILEKEQEQSVVYGSVDFGKTVVPNEKYNEMLKKTSSALKILPHKVINHEEKEVELLSSIECKGIKGNDGRYYVLDLLRTFPPDTNFLPDECGEVSEKVKSMGFPRKFRHKIVTLRQELIDAFVESRYVKFLRIASKQFQQQLKEKQQQKKEAGEGGDVKEVESGDPKQLVDQLMTKENNKEVIAAACREVGSLKTDEFEVRFNPDVLQPNVRHANADSEEFKQQVDLVKEAAEFLLVNQIQTFVKDCLEHNSCPVDGSMLSEILHHNGINIRYIGTVTNIVSKIPQLSYLHSICVMELITRCAKHVFRSYMQGVEMMCLASAVSHFLNCFLASFATPQNALSNQKKDKSKKQNRNKRNRANLFAADNIEWASETPKTMWRKIVAEAEDYFRFAVDSSCIDSAVEKYSFHKASLLRAFCKTAGVQLYLREYSLDNKSKQTFHEDDIIDMFPVAKNIHPKASDAYHVFTNGQAKIQQGLLRDGYELINEALNFLNNVYGAMHPEIAACNRLLARLNYIMGDYAEALVYQQRAVMMSERVLGIDHPNTITEYAHFALYCFANGQIPTALKIIYRARYLALLCHGDNHPEIALFDSNIGLILHAVMEFKLSLEFLSNALQLNIKFFGANSLKAAMNHNLLARTYSCMGEYRAAINSEKDALAIFESVLGKDHEKTKDSSEFLKKLTIEAVKFQKTVNQLSKGGKIEPPNIQIYAPTPQQVLETLNMINGIVFVHVSAEEIERFKQEMVKRHSAQAAIKQNGVANDAGDKEEAKEGGAAGGTEADGEAKANLEKGGCFDELE